MGDLADVYDSTRRAILGLLRDRPAEDQDRAVPATPGWSVRDVVAHLVGDGESILRGDYPRAFFEAFGDDAAVVVLNEWTSSHVSARRGRSLEALAREWDELTATLLPTMRGERPWQDDLPVFTDRVLITDLGVHQHDIYGAFGIEDDREGPPVKIGVAGYIATMDWRLRSDGGAAIALEAPGKRWVAGGDEPAATVRAPRFELFRALSGRRNLDQLQDYEWEGDPRPFLRYFYPYGIRTDALVE